MDPSSTRPTPDYAPPTPAPPWPIAILCILGLVGVVLSPGLACACEHGRFKVYLGCLCSGLLILRALIALALGERGSGWIAYLVVAIAGFIASPWIVEAIL